MLNTQVMKLLKSEQNMWHGNIYSIEHCQEQPSFFLSLFFKNSRL